MFESRKKNERNFILLIEDMIACSDIGFRFYFKYVGIENFQLSSKTSELLNKNLNFFLHWKIKTLRMI